MSSDRDDIDRSRHALEHGEELAEFFQVLAARLANDRGGARNKQEARAPRKTTSPGSRLRVGYVAGIGFAMVVGASTLHWRAQRQSVSLPPDLMGIWETPASGYEGRSIEIRAGSVTISAGGSDVMQMAIARVDTLQAPDATTWIIHYQPGSIESEFRFQYFEGPPEKLTLIHQPAIEWHLAHP